VTEKVGSFFPRTKATFPRTKATCCRFRALGTENGGNKHYSVRSLNGTVVTNALQRVYRLPFSPVACDGGVPHAARLNAVFLVTWGRPDIGIQTGCVPGAISF